MKIKTNIHYVYYALAVVDILTVIASIVIITSLVNVYDRTVSYTDDWIKRQGLYLEALDLAAQLDSPGNDLFSSLDLAGEKERYAVIQEEFLAVMGKVKLDFAQHLSKDPDMLPYLSREFSSLIDEMQVLHREFDLEARKVFQAFPNDRAEAARVMASMDHKFSLLQGVIAKLTVLIGDHLTHRMNLQAETAREYKQYEKYIVIVLIFMMFSVVFYGHALSNKLKRAYEKAEKASVNKSHFLAEMSHEIRTPMNGVIGTAELLSKTPLTNKQRKYVDVIISSGHNMVQLVNEVLDFSRIEAGKIEINEEAFDLHNTIEEQATLMQVLAQEKSLKYALEYDSFLPKYVYGDALRIRQVLTNHISNAIKFTPKGGSVSVKVKMDEEREGFVKFEIVDTGVGIPREKHDSVYKVFEQISNRNADNKLAGSGLGLSICKYLVELMRGHVGFDSVEYSGSTFWFSIPIEPAQEHEVQYLSHREEKLSEDGLPNYDYNVLVVEDVVTNQFVMSNMLERMGCKVDIANNGAEAVELTQQNKYNVIFMDCNMPVKDGYQATREIREKGGAGKAKIIALTANVQDKDKCMDAGMDAFLGKPVNLQNLRDELDKLRRRR